MPIDSQVLEPLAGAFRGRLITPTDPDYDEARTIYNAMIDKRPALIAMCTDAADVIAAVNFGREQALDVAVRCGGHNGPGLGLADDGLVIDVSGLGGVRVDPKARTARVGAGCKWGDVDHATHAFGLAAVSGVISTTGVAGLTLGGGHGYLTRRHGLTIDNLLSVDLVLADGRFLTADAEHNADLFWAVRGGGGNFGVVTSFEFGLHPVATVIGGPMFWAIDDLETTLRWYRDWQPTAPRDVCAFYMTGQVPDGPPFPEAVRTRKVCGVVWCCTGTAKQADKALVAARAAAKPIFEHVGEVPFPMLQSLFDAIYPPGLQWYWKGDFFKEIDDEAVAVHQRFAEVPTAHSLMHLYPVDGAVHDVAVKDTPWAWRDVNWSMVIAGVDPDAANRERITAWARDYWRELSPHSSGAAYINFMMEEGADRVKATYGPNHERLRRIKAKYDPDNLFRVNHNIVPAEGKKGRA